MSAAARPRSLLQEHPRSLYVPLLALLAAVALGCGLFLPILSVEKALFFDNEFSVFSATVDFFAEANVLLGLVMAVTVIVLPLARLLALVLLWLWRLPAAGRTRVQARLAFLAKWSMADVFALALIVVGINLREELNARALPGAAVFFGGVLLSSLVLWHANRRLTEPAAG